MLAKEKKQVLVRLEPQIKKQLRMIAAKNDMSVSATIEQLLVSSLATVNKE